LAQAGIVRGLSVDPRRMRRFRPALVPVLLAASLAACGERATTRIDPATGEPVTPAELPSPQDPRGSITGMPDRPGPGRVGTPAGSAFPQGLPVTSEVAAEALDAPAVAADGETATADTANPEAGVVAGDPTPPLPAPAAAEPPAEATEPPPSR
jgi:hypothetical protein